MSGGTQIESLVARILILLSCVAMLFAVAVWVVFDWDYAEHREMEAIVFEIPEVSAAQSGEGQYINAIDRPLFWPSRRAPTDSLTPPIANNGGETNSDFRFIGALVKGGDKHAMLASDQQFYKVREGDQIQQWTVKKVTSSSVLLVSANGELELAPVKTTSTDKIEIRPVN